MVADASSRSPTASATVAVLASASTPASPSPTMSAARPPRRRLARVVASQSRCSASHAAANASGPPRATRRSACRVQSSSRPVPTYLRRPITRTAHKFGRRACKWPCVQVAPRVCVYLVCISCVSRVVYLLCISCVCISCISCGVSRVMYLVCISSVHLVYLVWCISCVCISSISCGVSRVVLPRVYLVWCASASPRGLPCARRSRGPSSMPPATRHALQVSHAPP